MLEITWFVKGAALNVFLQSFSSTLKNENPMFDARIGDISRLQAEI